MVWIRSLSVPLGEVYLAADLSATTKYSVLLCPGMRRAGLKVADKPKSTSAIVPDTNRLSLLPA